MTPWSWTVMFAGSLLVMAPVMHAQRAIGPADRFPYQPGIDVQHYDVALTLPARGSEILATATLRVDRSRTIDTLRLDLIALSVDAVTVNGRTRAVVRDSAAIRIPLLARDGTRLRVEVQYHGAPADGLIIREDSLRGWSAFGDNWPNRARYWIPTVDHPSDKATVSWRVTAPVGRAVVANGTRVADAAAVTHRDGSKWVTTRFHLMQPIPTYLMVVGAANLHETSLGRTACGAAVGGRCVPQSVFTFGPETPNMPGTFQEAGRIVSTFASLVGPFVYARLSHVQSATRFGGMENATAIFYSDKAFRDNAVGVGLIAHETAHQWFGNAVTPRRWADLWLSEGVSTYLAAVYTQRSRGDSAFRMELERLRREIIEAPIVAQRPVVDSVGGEAPLTMLNANSYQKGGFVLHMLRARMGDGAFFGALRDYQKQHRHGTAVTDDLRRAFERRSGSTLESFFDQWLHRPGWADLTVSWVWNAATASVVMQIVQGTRFPPYAVTLTVLLRDVEGRERIVHTTLAPVLSQQMIVPAAGMREVTDVIADPKAELLGNVTVLRAMP